MSGVVASVSRRIRADEILKLMREHPDITNYALISVALLAGKAIAGIIRRRVPRHTILEIDLDDKFREQPQAFQFFEHTHTLQELVDTIHYARQDAKVSAIYVKIKPSFNLQMAQIQELRDSIEKFKLAGKLAVVYADTYGEISNGTRLYYLASAFSLIFVQQSGAICLAGPSVDAPFIRNTLSKIGVSPEISQRKLYKSMANLFKEEKLTPEHREMVTSLLGDLYEQIITGIATGRRISEEVVRAKLLKGIHSSTDALDGLVDGARYQDEVHRSLLDQLKISQSKANFLFWHKYRSKRGGKYSKKNKHVIALVYATGNIHTGKSQQSDFSGSSASIGSDSLCAVLRTIAKDSKVKAIVLRVDSGGGSYVASDSIYHEVLAAKNAGKKIVVSMGNVAASGGYFISMAADQILAEPGTLTGSIGVLAGKLVTREMWEKLGVTHDQVKIKMPNDDGSGLYNDYYSSLHSYEEGDYIRKREEVLDYIYDDFTKKVAFSRKLNREQVEAAAQGRVWTGRQALERGLIDQLGGVEEAITVAKALTNIPTTATPFVQIYPKINWFQLVNTPKNREEADASGLRNTQTLKALDAISLLSNVGTLANTYAPFLSAAFPSSSAPVSLPAETNYMYQNF